MSIISTIGRRAWKVRLLIWTIYVGLTVGAISMLYPFGLMIAGSTKSYVDTPDPELIPRYLVSQESLWQKYSEALFNESSELARSTFQTDALSFRDLPEPSNPNPALSDIWQEFCKETRFPFYAYVIGHVEAPRTRGVLPSNLRAFKRLLASRFEGSIDRVNRELGSEFVGWNAVYQRPTVFLGRRERPGISGIDDAYRQFAEARPLRDRVFLSLEGYYRMVFLRTRYGRDIADYNKAVGSHYTCWSQVHLWRRLADASGVTQGERQDWEAFVRTIASMYWLRVDDVAAPDYHAFLRAKHRTLDKLNTNYRSGYASWEAIPLVTEPPMDGMVVSDWSSWLEGWQDPDTGVRYAAPLESIRVHSVDFIFRDWLKERFGDIANFESRIVNASQNPTSDLRPPTFSSWMDIGLPQEDFLFLDFQTRTGELRREYTTRNFASVIDYVVLHGRGIMNTVIYCALAILSSLLVNPLAAYALSRYKPPSQYKILLFLMLTMSFPPMVTQIPVFLMLREFHLLNTFAALVLPGLANGYSIFLLKGFFDSLPRELYESAEIDGAGEFHIFFQITMSLSKPILAVIALNAFNMAYANFMMALLICQNEKMWTLMPWLFQLQQRSGEGVVFASLLIAAIPTLTVFAFCQNVIMRGIVVPVEK